MTLVEKVPYTIVSNNAKPDNTPAWQSGTAYVWGQKVIYNDKIYTCAVGNSSTTPPDKNINEWAETGNTNPTKFQDDIVNTQTENGQDNLEIKINIDNNFVNGIAFFNMDGKKVSIYDRNSVLLYEKSLTTRDVINTWWQYFFGGAFTFINDVWYLSSLDLSGDIKMVIEPNEKGANLGHLVVGKKRFLGHTLYEPAISILDYSKKITDEWGNTRVREGKTAKYASVRVVMPTGQVDSNQKILARNAGKLCLFIGDERDQGFESLSIFGLYKDMEMVIPNADMSELDINLEGVI